MRDASWAQAFQAAPLSYPRWLLAPLGLYWPPRLRDAFYLTIDDGPHPAGVSMLLPLLARYQAQATFFWLAWGATEPLLFQKLRKEGHTLGLHGLNHTSPWRLSKKQWRQEVETAWSLLSQHWGQPIRYYRPPYGHYRKPPLQLKIVLWDHMPPDYKHQEGWSKPLLKRLKAGDVVVLHERANLVLSEWEMFLAGAHKMGLRAVPLP